MAYTEANFAIENPQELEYIRNFLIQNPSFVRDDEDLLNCLTQCPETGNVVSLENLARNRMLKETHKAKSRFSQIVETARKNYESQIRVQEAIIAVMDTNSIDELQETLRGHVAFSLAADSCEIIISHTPAYSENLDKIGSLIERLVPVERSVAIGTSDVSRPWLYGDKANYIKSEALARLEFGNRGHFGMLAIASSDIDCFRQDMGHELITFFARVVERQLARFEQYGEI